MIQRRSDAWNLLALKLGVKHGLMGLVNTGEVFSKHMTSDELKPRYRLFLLAVFCMTFALHADAEAITEARYASPVVHYGHFALGRPHEYAHLKVETDVGRSLTFELPADEVFEDLKPRIVSFSADKPKEVLAIVSQRNTGSRLVLIRQRDEHLELSAESAPIGMPNRWMNPIGVADLDGDGIAEVAAVITPHIGGTLRIYRRTGRKLVEIASLAGFSNHVYGSSELGMSTMVFMAGRMHLLLPDATRMRLRLIKLEGGKLVEVGSCAVASRVTGAISAESTSEISIGLASGQQTIALNSCLTDGSLAR